MIGKKRLQFEKIFNLAENIKSFDYMLPPKCKDEILTASNLSGKSIRLLSLDSGYDLEIKKQYPSISNTKAEYFVSRLYCPETYKMLMADYIPLKIKNIKPVGQRHVYDIEVSKNHNYIANGLIVHNCFAKKTGTEKYIPVIRNGGYIETIRGDRDDRYVPGYIQVVQEKYGMTKERAERSIEYFLRVIEDASSYLFSKNHSVPYSMIGLYIGYLRYYYPLQLLTAALNVYKANASKMDEIKKYAKSKGIEIKPIKFGKSRADYFMDVNENCIYQDIESIKDCSAKGAEELYELSKNHYDNFVDLLFDIKEKTSLDSNQLDILIRLDFFSDFGDMACLSYIVLKYQSLMKRKTIKKNEIIDIGLSEGEIKKFSASETDTRVDDIDAISYIKDLGYSESDIMDCMKYKYQKQEDGGKIKIPNGYSMKKVIKKFPSSDEFILQHATKIVIGCFSDINKRGLLKYMMNHVDFPKTKLSTKIKNQVELLGGIVYKDPSLDKMNVVVTKLNTMYSPKFNAYSIATGQTVEMKIHKRKNPKDKRIKTSWADLPLNDGDIIYICDCKREIKKRKNPAGGFDPIPGEFEWWIKDYKKVDL